MQHQPNITVPVSKESLKLLLVILNNDYQPIDGLLIAKRGTAPSHIILISIEETIYCRVTENTFFYFLKMPSGSCLRIRKK